MKAFGTKCHLFPRHPGKDAAQGPSKLPEGRRPEGSFGGPRAASFSGGRGKRWHFNIINWLSQFMALVKSAQS